MQPAEEEGDLVSFTKLCPCGERIEGRAERRGSHVDMQFGCGECGREFVVTVTQIEGPTP